MNLREFIDKQTGKDYESSDLAWELGYSNYETTRRWYKEESYPNKDGIDRLVENLGIDKASLLQFIYAKKLDKAICNG